MGNKSSKNALKPKKGGREYSFQEIYLDCTQFQAKETVIGSVAKINTVKLDTTNQNHNEEKRWVFDNRKSLKNYQNQTSQKFNFPLKYSFPAIRPLVLTVDPFVEGALKNILVISQRKTNLILRIYSVTSDLIKSEFILKVPEKKFSLAPDLFQPNMAFFHQRQKELVFLANYSSVIKWRLGETEAMRKANYVPEIDQEVIKPFQNIINEKALPRFTRFHQEIMKNQVFLIGFGSVDSKISNKITMMTPLLVKNMIWRRYESEVFIRNRFQLELTPNGAESDSARLGLFAQIQNQIKHKLIRYSIFEYSKSMSLISKFSNLTVILSLFDPRNLKVTYRRELRCIDIVHSYLQENQNKIDFSDLNAEILNLYYDSAEKVLIIACLVSRKVVLVRIKNLFHDCLSKVTHKEVEIKNSSDLISASETQVEFKQLDRSRMLVSIAPAIHQVKKRHIGNMFLTLDPTSLDYKEVDGDSLSDPLKESFPCEYVEIGDEYEVITLPNKDGSSSERLLMTNCRGAMLLDLNEDRMKIHEVVPFNYRLEFKNDSLTTFHEQRLLADQETFLMMKGNEAEGFILFKTGSIGQKNSKDVVELVRYHRIDKFVKEPAKEFLFEFGTYLIKDTLLESGNLLLMIAFNNKDSLNLRVVIFIELNKNTLEIEEASLKIVRTQNREQVGWKWGNIHLYQNYLILTAQGISRWKGGYKPSFVLVDLDFNVLDVLALTSRRYSDYLFYQSQESIIILRDDLTSIELSSIKINQKHKKLKFVKRVLIKKNEETETIPHHSAFGLSLTLKPEDEELANIEEKAKRYRSRLAGLIEVELMPKIYTFDFDLGLTSVVKCYQDLDEAKIYPLNDLTFLFRGRGGRQSWKFSQKTSILRLTPKSWKSKKSVKAVTLAELEEPFEIQGDKIMFFVMSKYDLRVAEINTTI